MSTLPTSLPRRRNTISPLVVHVLFLGLIFLILLLFIEPVRPSDWILGGCLVTVASLIWADTAEWRTWSERWKALASATGLAIRCQSPRFPFRTGYICLDGEYQGYRVKLHSSGFRVGQAHRLHQYTQITLEGVASVDKNWLIELAEVGRFQFMRFEQSNLVYREQDRITDDIYLKAILDFLVYLADHLGSKNHGAPA